MVNWLNWIRITVAREARQDGGNGVEYGYARVSSKDQNLERQLLAMSDAGLPDKHIFKDKKSGKDFERPEYRRLLKKLR